VVQAYQEQLLDDLIEQHGGWLPEAEVKKRRLGKLLGLVGDRLREREGDPYRILAELPASVYVTTNFDPLIERALKASDRDPQQLATRWRYKKARSACPRSTSTSPDPGTRSSITCSASSGPTARTPWS
jgi:hypothetical protein